MRFASALKAVALATALTLSMGVSAQAVTLHMHNGGEPGSIDPHKVSGNWENRIVGDYLEGLMTEDINAEAMLGQAASYSVSNDGLVYTFVLRDDVVWSDGVPVTAGDFVAAFQRIMNPELASDYAYLQYPIKNAAAINSGDITDFDQLGVKALDDKTVEITLENPTPFFLQALTHYTAYPVPSHLLEKVGDDWTKMENILANGPYKIVEWLPGSHVRSVRNESYYDAANVQIDEVFYYIQEDLPAALLRYRAGEFDIMTDFPADQYSLLQSKYPGEAQVEPFLGVYYYVMNQENPKLQDVNVRKALSIAINRKVIGPDILGTGELPAYSWVPPGVANYEGASYLPSWADDAYDVRVAEAKSLMEAAGYTSDNPLSLQLRYNTNDNHQRIAVAVSAMWKEIGVDVELFNSEVAVHYDALRAGDYEIGRAGWIMDYNDPINMLDLLKGGVENNYGRYDNAEFNDLLDESNATLDLAARAVLMQEAEAIAMDEFGVIPIYFYVSKNAVSPKISGFVNNAADIHRNRWLTKAE